MLCSLDRSRIIDCDETAIPGKRYRTIQEAIADTDNNDLSTNYDVIIVETGTYVIDGTNTPENGDRRTVSVHSNVTIIGRGNAIIEISNNVIRLCR